MHLFSIGAEATTRAATARLLRAAFLCLALIAAGCGGDEPLAPATDGSVHGAVTLTGGAGSVAGIQVILQVSGAEGAGALQVPRGARSRLLGSRADLPAIAAATMPPASAPAAGAADTTFTNGSGEFVFDGVAPGSYNLYLEGGAVLRAFRTGVTVEAGRRTELGTIALTPTGSISGTVELEGAGDHSGAVVFVAGTSYAAYSDAAGNFAITGVPVGTWTVMASKEGHLPASRAPVAVVAGEATALGEIFLALGPVSGVVAFQGTVQLPGGPAGPGVLVLAVGLDSDGRGVGTLGSAFTAADGSFGIAHAYPLAPTTSVAIEAFAPGASYAGFATLSTGLAVGPVSTGVFEVITMIVETEGGRGVSDFTPAEVNQAVAEAAAELASAGTDLADAAAVRALVLAEVGGLIADLSGGSFSVGPSLAAVTSDPPDVRTDIVSFAVELTDAHGELWDVYDDGGVGDGTDDAYDGMFYLEIDGAAFPSQLAGTPEAQLEDGREVALGPVADLGAVGLSVVRKAFVPSTGAFARFAELLTNTGGLPITVDVRIYGNLGSDESIDLVNYSSDGNASVDPGDRWIASHWDGDDPAVAFFFPGASPAKFDDDVEYSWPGVTIEAGATVVLYHWGFQLTGGPVSQLAQLLQEIEEEIPEEYFESLSVAEASAGLFAGSAANLLGEAGSVAPLATVTFDNQTAAVFRTLVANSDGSFRAVLPRTESGHMVHVTATDGTDVLVAVP